MSVEAEQSVKDKIAEIKNAATIVRSQVSSKSDTSEF